ncbi:GABA transporter 1-like protein [Tanacetum coccineum]
MQLFEEQSEPFYEVQSEFDSEIIHDTHDNSEKDVILSLQTKLKEYAELVVRESELLEKIDQMKSQVSELLEKLRISNQEMKQQIYNNLLASNDVLKKRLETKFKFSKHDTSLEKMIEMIEKEYESNVLKISITSSTFKTKNLELVKEMRDKVKSFDEEKKEFETKISKLEKLASQNYTSLQKDKKYLKKQHSSETFASQNHVKNESSKQAWKRRKTVPNRSWLHCGYHLTTAIVAPALLSLPFALALLGWKGGVVVLTLAAMVTFYSYNLLSLVLEHHAELGKRQLRFRDMAHDILVIACTLLGGQSLKFIYLLARPDGSMQLSHFIVIFGILTLILAQIPSFHSLRHINLVSLILCFAYCACTIAGAIYIATSARSDSRQRSPQAKRTEVEARRRQQKGTPSRTTSQYSESEDSEGGHWKSKSRRQRSKTYEDDLSQPWTYPDDHLKLFQSAAKTEGWAMPTWCHMFNSTLTGNARVWFDKLPKESIDSYEDLRTAFRENYLQQTKHIKDPVEIHHIKQRDGESTEDFMERYKAEVLDVEELRSGNEISGLCTNNSQLVN